MIPIPIIIGIIIVVVYLISVKVGSYYKEKKSKDVTPPKIDTDTTTKKPEEKKVEKNKGGDKPKLFSAFLSEVWKTIKYTGITVIIITIGWLIYCGVEEVISIKVEERLQTSSVVNRNRPVIYDWTWKLPPGVHVRGRNKNAPDERNVEVIKLDSKRLWFNLYYKERGSDEVCRIRLENIGGTSWKGTWDQDNPRDSGWVFMEEIVPGVYTGEILLANRCYAKCTLRKKTNL